MAKQSSNNYRAPYFWAVARMALGFTFLWAFFDKLFGLGFATCRDAKTDTIAMLCDKAWVSGGSPTSGFLEHATRGPLAGFYQNLAGNVLIDVLFMGGLLLIGFALVAGIGMKLATIFGTLLLVMMWSAALLPENNPVIDDHIIYAVLLFGLLAVNDKQKWGFRGWWLKQPVVKRFSILE